MEIKAYMIENRDKKSGATALCAVESNEGFSYNQLTKELTCRVFHIGGVFHSHGVSIKPKEHPLDIEYLQTQLHNKNNYKEDVFGQPFHTVNSQYVELMQVSHRIDHMMIDHGGFLTVVLKPFEKITNLRGLEIGKRPKNWVWLDELIEIATVEPDLVKLKAMLRVFPVMGKDSKIKLDIITCDILGEKISSTPKQH